MKITIVTINYNNKEGLRETIKSVSNQNYRNIEYIIVDGNSRDGSIQVINEFESIINKKIIEEDEGLFEAMNKGLEAATGEYIIFMNSGDSFYDNNVLNKIGDFIELNNYPDIIYGKTVVKYDNEYSKIMDPGRDINFGYGLPFCHQSMLIKTEIQKQYPFDTSYDIYSCFDNYYKLWNSEFKFLYVSEIISRFRYDGISSTFTFKGLKEKYLIGSKYKKFNKVKFAIHFLDKIFRAFIKALIPHSIKRKLQVIK